MSSDDAPHDARSLRTAVLIAILIGTIIRLALAGISEGTNDVLIWNALASDVSNLGLLETYRVQPLMNHPPLPVLWDLFATHFGTWFSFVMKLPAIAADAVACALLARAWLARGDARRAKLAAFSMALNPVAILIAGYHCNTDNVYACLSLLAMYLIGARQAFFLGGLALGAAINVKLIPLLLIPVAFSLSHTRRNALRVLAGLAIGAIPFIPLLAAFSAVKQKMLGYSPPVSDWGVGLILHDLFGDPKFARAAKAMMQQYLAVGRWIILLGAAWIAPVSWRTRRWNGYELGTLVYALFLILAPGFGWQYMVSIIPLLLATSVSRAWLYSIPAAIFLLLSYWSRLVAYELPLRTLYPPNSGTPPGSPFGVMAWFVLVLIALEIVVVRGAQKRET